MPTAHLLYGLRAHVILLVAAFSLASLPAQHVTETNAISWWIYSGDHPLHGPWGVFTEVQARRANFLSIWQQLQIRDAATYRFSPQLRLVRVMCGRVLAVTENFSSALQPVGLEKKIVSGPTCDVRINLIFLRTFEAPCVT